MLVSCRFMGLVFILLLALSSVAGAQVVAPETGHWQHSWTGYFWVPGYNGDAVIGGKAVDVDVSVSDTVSALQDYFEAGFAGHYEGNKEPWGIIADVNYWRMEGTLQTAQGPATLTPRQFIVELDGTRTLSEKKMGDFAVQKLQLILGARYNMFKVRLDGSGYANEGSKNLVDPLVGARIYQALSRQWGVLFRADLGGFGIGSDLAVNVSGTVGYNLSPRNSILFGWKYYSLDFDDGPNFNWDVAQSGPFLAFQTRF